MKNNNETTYLERAGAMNVVAMASRIKADAEKYAAFKSEMRAVEEHSVPAANITRELGLSFAEYWLPGDATAAENYFNAQYRPLLKMSFAVFQWIIAAARRLPDKCSGMEDLYPALKQMWFAGELIAEGERAAPQEAHDITPVVAVFSRLGKAREALERTFEDATSWDEDTRTGVREQIAKFEEWLVKMKTKI